MTQTTFQTEQTRKHSNRVVSFLLDLLIPKFCMSCGRWGEFLCSHCSTQIMHVTGQVCFACKAPSMWGITHSFCRGKCILDGVQVLYTYNTITRALIHAAKYKNLRNIFLDMLKSKPNITISFSFLLKNKNIAFIPIPLSKGRLLNRGYNQAEVLSNYFATSFSFPVLLKTLIRTRETKPQSKLKSLSLKKDNVKDAFSVSTITPLPEVCILVDDVLTTGATLMEAGTLLKKHGAKKVFAITLTGAFHY